MALLVERFVRWELPRRTLDTAEAAQQADDLAAVRAERPRRSRPPRPSHQPPRRSRVNRAELEALPAVVDVATTARVMGLSRTAAYELMRGRLAHAGVPSGPADQDPDRADAGVARPGPHRRQRHSRLARPDVDRRTGSSEACGMKGHTYKRWPLRSSEGL